MALKRLNLFLIVDFFRGAADLKKYVSINTRKQARQKREGISASQF